MNGVVFDIQRFTISDGPGLRTEIFLKGCPLSCKWCSNPEGGSPRPEIGVYSAKCISRKSCGDCSEVCEHDALVFSRGKISVVDRSRCSGCFRCSEECPADAIKVWGREMSVEECMEIIRRDKGFYERSGGGVSLSGGEPLMQSAFAAELLKACKDEDINTCCDTALHAGWDKVEKILPYTDLLISDIKYMDSDVHMKYTGAGNEKILGKLRRLAGTATDIILRIPLIPGINDDDRNIEKTADFIIDEMNGNIQLLQLLSYMRLGLEKYKALGKEYEMDGLRFNRRSFQKRVRQTADYFRSRGINCQIGTSGEEEL